MEGDAQQGCSGMCLEYAAGSVQGKFVRVGRRVENESAVFSHAKETGAFKIFP